MPNGHPLAVVMSATEPDRRAYALLLREQLSLEVTLEADFAPVALWEALRRRPDALIILADRLQPVARDAIQMVRRLHPLTRVAVVCGLDDPPLLQTWGQCGLDAFVLKSGGLEEFRHAVRAVLAGQSYVSPAAARVLEFGRPAQNGQARLSRRESELLPLLARGMTLRDAAGVLSVSYKTADSYRTSLLRKLGLRDRVELARYAIREGIIDA